MILIEEETSVKAWLRAVRHLRNQNDRRDYTVILAVKNAMRLCEKERAVQTDLDAILRRNSSSISTVINTIFPVTLYLRHGKDGMFQRYLEMLPKLKEEMCNNRGTYAARMLNRSNGTNTINPLALLITKLAKQAKKSSPKRATYELGIIDPLLDIPIYGPDSDAEPIMGFPCLSHISFKLKGDHKLMLTAFYRSHYYIERALGNLFGLAWLQHFVAKETGLETAELICISSMALLETKTQNKRKGVLGWKLSDIDSLINRHSGLFGTIETVQKLG